MPEINSNNIKKNQVLSGEIYLTADKVLKVCDALTSSRTLRNLSLVLRRSNSLFKSREKSIEEARVQLRKLLSTVFQCENITSLSLTFTSDMPLHDIDHSTHEGVYTILNDEDFDRDILDSLSRSKLERLCITSTGLVAGNRIFSFMKKIADKTENNLQLQLTLNVDDGLSSWLNSEAGQDFACQTRDFLCDTQHQLVLKSKDKVSYGAVRQLNTVSTLKDSNWPNEIKTLLFSIAKADAGIIKKSYENWGFQPLVWISNEHRSSSASQQYSFCFQDITDMFFKLLIDGLYIRRANAVSGLNIIPMDIINEMNLIFERNSGNWQQRREVIEKSINELRNNVKKLKVLVSEEVYKAYNDLAIEISATIKQPRDLVITPSNVKNNLYKVNNKSAGRVSLCEIICNQSPVSSIEIRTKPTKFFQNTHIQLLQALDSLKKFSYFLKDINIVIQPYSWELKAFREREAELLFKVAVYIEKLLQTLKELVRHSPKLESFSLSIIDIYGVPISFGLDQITANVLKGLLAEVKNHKTLNKINIYFAYPKDLLLDFGMDTNHAKYLLSIVLIKNAGRTFSEYDNGKYKQFYNFINSLYQSGNLSHEKLLAATKLLYYSTHAAKESVFISTLKTLFIKSCDDETIYPAHTIATIKYIVTKAALMDFFVKHKGFSLLASTKMYEDDYHVLKRLVDIVNEVEKTHRGHCILIAMRNLFNAIYAFKIIQCTALDVIETGAYPENLETISICKLNALNVRFINVVIAEIIQGLNSSNEYAGMMLYLAILESLHSGELLPKTEFHTDVSTLHHISELSCFTLAVLRHPKEMLLLQLATKANLTSMRKLVADGAIDIHYRYTECKNTILHEIALKEKEFSNTEDFIETFNQLTAFGIDPKLKNKNGKTAIELISNADIKAKLSNEVITPDSIQDAINQTIPMRPCRFELVDSSSIDSLCEYEDALKHKQSNASVIAGSDHIKALTNAPSTGTILPDKVMFNKIRQFCASFTSNPELYTSFNLDWSYDFSFSSEFKAFLKSSSTTLEDKQWIQLLFAATGVIPAQANFLSKDAGVMYIAFNLDVLIRVIVHEVPFENDDNIFVYLLKHNQLDKFLLLFALAMEVDPSLYEQIITLKDQNNNNLLLLMLYNGEGQWRLAADALLGRILLGLDQTHTSIITSHREGFDGKLLLTQLNTKKNAPYHYIDSIEKVKYFRDICQCDIFNDESEDNINTKSMMANITSNESDQDALEFWKNNYNDVRILMKKITMGVINVCVMQEKYELLDYLINTFEVDYANIAYQFSIKVFEEMSEDNKNQGEFIKSIDARLCRYLEESELNNCAFFFGRNNKPDILGLTMLSNSLKYLAEHGLVVDSTDDLNTYFSSQCISDQVAAQLFLNEFAKPVGDGTHYELGTTHMPSDKLGALTIGGSQLHQSFIHVLRSSGKAGALDIICTRLVNNDSSYMIFVAHLYGQSLSHGFGFENIQTILENHGANTVLFPIDSDMTEGMRDQYFNEHIQLRQQAADNTEALQLAKQSIVSLTEAVSSKDKQLSEAGRKITELQNQLAQTTNSLNMVMKHLGLEAIPVQSQPEISSSTTSFWEAPSSVNNVDPENQDDDKVSPTVDIVSENKNEEVVSTDTIADSEKQEQTAIMTEKDNKAFVFQRSTNP